MLDRGEKMVDENQYQPQADPAAMDTQVHGRFPY